MSVRSRRTTALTALGVCTALGLTLAPASSALAPPLPLGETAEAAFAPQLVTVKTPDRAAKARLQGLGLDLTEHAGRDYVEVVLHTAADEAALRAGGFSWDVRIGDLLERELERIRLDKAYAARTTVSPLPSGRDSYRTLADFGAEIDKLVKARPDIAKRISIGKSVEGRDFTGIEIGRDVRAPENGRPVFLMFGAHHAREWPSAELPMEFAHDLVENDGAKTELGKRITGLLDKGRVIIVPVSNPDGYDASRTAGDVVDLREADGGGTVAILGTPGNAYKRKNCRYVDGQTQPAGTCVLPPSNGGFGLGVDLNRNYGALWGGPGTSDVPADPVYRGPAPFSEPETQAIRNLISTRQVTTLITNHTFSNLILRPVGVAPTTVGPDGLPAGFAPDECFTDSSGKDAGMQALGERMAAQNGYSNQFGWELYDTTGTTEDYSYNATGGYGYTFEVGPNEFHPPYEQVVAEYTGDNPAAKGVTKANADELTTEAADSCRIDTDGDGTADKEYEHDHKTVGGGNREAFLIAFENAVNSKTHALIKGEAPAGSTLTLERTGVFPLWDRSKVADTVSTSMVVGASGEFTWHTNPSTRPFVQSRKAAILGGPKETFSASGQAPAFTTSDTTIEVKQPADVLQATLTATVGAGADTLKAFDLVLLDAAGEEVASARNFAASNTLAWTGPGGKGVPPGTYTLRVEAGVPAVPDYSIEAHTADVVSDSTKRQFEQWTLTCLDAQGNRLGQAGVTVERGRTADLGEVCAARKQG